MLSTNPPPPPGPPPPPLVGWAFPPRLSGSFPDHAHSVLVETAGMADSAPPFPGSLCGPNESVRSHPHVGPAGRTGVRQIIPVGACPPGTRCGRKRDGLKGTKHGFVGPRGKAFLVAHDEQSPLVLNRPRRQVFPVAALRIVSRPRRDFIRVIATRRMTTASATAERGGAASSVPEGSADQSIAPIIALQPGAVKVGGPRVRLACYDSHPRQRLFLRSHPPAKFVVVRRKDSSSSDQPFPSSARPTTRFNSVRFQRLCGSRIV